MIVRRLCGLLLAALVVVACGSPEPEPPAEQPMADEPVSPARSDAVVTAYMCPTSTLLPQQSRDICGARIVAQVFSGLAELDPRTGEPKLLVASAIDTDDSIVWTIEIEPGWTFHNGESVTARSFVDAWNFGADPDNEMRNRDFFADIEGYVELQAGEADSLRGLRVVDDYTIEVTLSEPFAPFLARLTDSAFFPLPSIAYEDISVFARRPIGNGRYRLVAYDAERAAELERFDEWPGPDPAIPQTVHFLVYAGDAALQTAYLDVRAGALDVLEAAPPQYLDQVEADFGARVTRTATSSFTFLGLPMYDARFGDNLALRQALSMAIDRDQIIADVFDGSLTAAASLIPPVLDSHRSDACEYCVYDPERARELLDEAGGWDGPLTLSFNSGAGHDVWIEAVAQQLSENLGIDAITYQSMDLSAYINLLDSRELAGPFRLAWALSYLSPEYALSELYRSDSTYNYFGYANPTFDAALDTANASLPEEAMSYYQHAEDIVLTDMPLIPLWYGTSVSVHTARVSNVIVDAGSLLRVDQLEVLG